MATISFADAIRTILETEALEKASAKLGVDRDTLARILREGAGLPAFAPPKPVQERLFAPPPEEKKPELPPAQVPRRATLYTDGASRGNPGLAGAGAVLLFGDGRTPVRLKKFLGVQTNNVAEYEGVILGLEKALDLGIRELDVKADSMLAMMQLKGEWKLKHEGLKPLFQRARELIAKFDKVTFTHIPREQNGAADEMSNRAIDERAT